jgi:ATPases with chaperone activity, ATP-binding subunit
MFERFTDRARRVVVLAQEEARMLNHNYIGTEHILLGLIHEGEGVAAKALESLGIALEGVRQQVEEIIGQGSRRRAGTSRSRRGPRRSWSCLCARRSSSATTTSAPSTSCSA